MTEIKHGDKHTDILFRFQRLMNSQHLPFDIPRIPNE